MTQILKLTLAACAILTAGSAIAAELPPSALGIFGTTTSICANPKAGTGRLPDAKMRQRMASHIESL